MREPNPPTNLKCQNFHAYEVPITRNRSLHARTVPALEILNFHACKQPITRNRSLHATTSPALITGKTKTKRTMPKSVTPEIK